MVTRASIALTVLPLTWQNWNRLQTLGRNPDYVSDNMYSECQSVP